MDPVAVMESSFAPFDARLQPGRMDPVPVFAVDLDQTDLAARWAWVRDYAHHFHAARQLILGEVGVNADAPTPLWVQVGARAILSATPAALRPELEACAAVCGVPAGELALLNYLYELKAKCSSFVVAQRGSGRPLHARTLDWPGCAVLCECTVRLRFLRGGRLLYESLTWPGYLGVLTACVPGRFSVSVNFRGDERAELPWELPGNGAVHTVVSEVLRRGVAMLGSLTGRCRSVGFSVRQMIEQEPPVDFEGALSQLSSVQLLAPVYFTLAGPERGEGAILVRGPAPIPLPTSEGEAWRIRRLDDPAYTRNGLLYQANSDTAVSAGDDELLALQEEEGQGGLVSWDRIRVAQALADRYGPQYSLADVIDMVTAQAGELQPQAKRLEVKVAEMSGIANTLTIFSCVLDPSAPSGDALAIRCARHSLFESVEYEDGSKGEEIVLPKRKAGNGWRDAPCFQSGGASEGGGMRKRKSAAVGSKQRGKRKKG
uniref:Ceramidase 1 n=1 Tax=Emiliania huxleyi TaxID=2903 RepID=A0A068F4Y6_EMIHU|nr:ceramidase 1 [Emiliania huxleyi]